MKSLGLALALTATCLAQDLDGSKVFAADTIPTAPGAYSLNFLYLTSKAHTEFTKWWRAHTA